MPQPSSCLRRVASPSCLDAGTCCFAQSSDRTHSSVLPITVALPVPALACLHGLPTVTEGEVIPLQTIIECLKQVTTGELPPNTRSGQSFIHDPKVVRLSLCP